MIAIQVLTYNHAQYIRQCLDGIVAQRTEFPFVAVVHDDASTDGTADIVRDYAERYPDIIKPIFQTENQYSRGISPAKIAAEAVDKLNPKYKCFCDGDDYWTEPETLQLQCTYLEAHPDCAAVYTRNSFLMPSGEIKVKDESYQLGNDTLESLLMRNHVHFITAMIRMDVYRDYFQEVRPYDKKWLINDWAIWLYTVSRHQIKFIDHETAISRFVMDSITRPKSLKKRIKYLKCCEEIALYFARFNKRKDLERPIKKRIRRFIRQEYKDTIAQIFKWNRN